MGNLSFINGCNAEGIEDNFGSIDGGKYHQEIIISEFILNKLGKWKHPKIIKKEKIKPRKKSLSPTEYFSVQEKRPFIFPIFSPIRHRAFSNAAVTST
jgi:hypothetical protein